MKTIIFGSKEIIIRKLSNGDLRNVKRFQDLINFLLSEI